MSGSDPLLANLNAFKNKVKVGPSPVAAKMVESESKKRSVKEEESPLPKKIKRAETSTPEQSLSGTHLSTKLLLATEYIQERGEAVPIEQIESYLSLSPENNVIPLLKNINKIKFDVKHNTLQYVSIYDVHSAEELLQLLRAQVTFKGLSCKELKDGWPQCTDVIDELENKNRVLVLRTKKDNQPRFVWYNFGGSLGGVDEDFVKMWENCKLPQRGELPRKLQDLGLKPASVDPATLKRQSTRVEVKKRKQRRGKVTNTHMAGILKDYSDRV
ncbi:LANO_0G04852g1_1 [Lachancea nothofagi CBS 11611]|uniref:Transcription initiation factor IIE subunit beta n=1 Tax=Lachancea nothofagi CBS 11611 TaxID=1266666 RepID=A0A1G4KGJ2_9SACH|nr:LANO_0G04852g1_1 [Lachancea nothofagi CBS 11611]